MNCPCCSGKKYKDCCEPYHLNKELPLFPEELMRSRYTAFALHLIDYLVNTTHVSQRPYHSKKEIEQWAKSNKWLKLEIVKTWDNFVHFKAFYQDSLSDVYEHEELSTFKKEGEKWFYVDGQFDF